MSSPRHAGGEDLAPKEPQFSAADPEPIGVCGYRLQSVTPSVVPATVRREWMEQTHERFATRCLPMLLANQAGWFILNPVDVRAEWNGGDASRDLSIAFESVPPVEPPVVSYFGHGILTWRIPILFRTSPGTQLLARGPANRPKPDVYPLEGIVETSWSVATFTMNWKLLRPRTVVHFEKDEPICMLVPLRLSEFERITPTLQSISENVSLKQAYISWSQQRYQFIGNRDKGEWEKDYVRGKFRDVAEADEHRTRLNLAPFRNIEPAESSK